MDCAILPFTVDPGGSLGPLMQSFFWGSEVLRGPECQSQDIASSCYFTTQNLGTYNLFKKADRAWTKKLEPEKWFT